VRTFNPTCIYVIESRTEEDRPLLRPSRKNNDLSAGLLAHSLERFDGIELYAFCFLSNGFRMLLRDPRGELPKFMEDFKWEFAMKTNKRLGRKKARVFAGKYTARPVLDDAELLDVYAEIVCAPVLEGQVSTMAQSPFFGCHELLLGEMRQSYEWVDGTLLHNRTRRGQRVPLEEVTFTSELKLHPLPRIDGSPRKESARQRRERISGIIAAEEQRAAAERRRTGRKVLGARKVRSQDPLGHPPRTPMKPLRFQRSADDPLLLAYEAEVAPIIAAYRKTFRRYLAAAVAGLRRKLVWPPGTYPPSCLVPATG
jgi:hypothetical protein